ADTRPWNYLRRHNSGQGATNDFLRRCAHQYGPAARRGQCADPLSRIARGGAGDLEGWADARIGTIARCESTPPLCQRVKCGALYFGCTFWSPPGAPGGGMTLSRPPPG